MASLLDEEFARRDQTSPASSNGRGSYHARGGGGGADGLTAYQQATLQMRAEAAAQRATGAEMERDLADRRAGIADAQLRLQETAAAAREAETGMAMSEAQRFLTDSIELDPNAPDFDRRFLTLQAQTLRGSKHPEVQKRAQYLMDKRLEALELRKQQQVFEDSVNAGLVVDSSKAGDVTMRRLEAPVAKPDESEKERASRLSHLESLRMKSSVDEDVKAYLDQEITKLRQPPSAAATVIPERIATNPKTGEKVVLRDGKWVPLQ